MLEVLIELDVDEVEILELVDEVEVERLVDELVDEVDVLTEVEVL